MNLPGGPTKASATDLEDTTGTIPQPATRADHASTEGEPRGPAKLDLALGVIRTGVGTALMVAPGWAGRIWVGPGADGPGSKVFARALGARDVALGIRIIAGARRSEPVSHWVAAGFGADAADVIASALAGRHLTPGRRIAMPLLTGVAGVWSARHASAEGVR